MTSFTQLTRRRFAGALAALAMTALAGPAFAQAQPLTKIRFILDWRFEGPAALFLVPKAKKYFEQEGLDVTIDSGSGSGASVNRVASGAYEMGFADISAMIEFMANNQSNPGARMQAVYMVYDYSPAAVFTMKKSGILKPSDLNGKKLGAPVFDAGRKAFPMFVKANKLDSSKIAWTAMEPALRETMLVQGQVDAITGFTFTSLLNLNARGVKDEDVVMMKYADNGVKLYGNVVIASQKFIDQNPKAVAGFLRALTKGMKDVIADPAYAIQVLKERDPLINVELETRRLKMAIDDSIATPGFKADGIGAINKVRFEDTVSQVVSAFGIKQAVNSDNMFNSSFFPPKSERQIFSK